MSSEAEPGAYASVPGLDVDLDGPVLRLALDRPAARNSIDDVMMSALVGAVETAGQDERVRVVLLEGRGDHFCGGADIVARNAPGGRPRVGSIQRRLPTAAHRLVPALLSVQTPVVCSVRGWAVGIGFHLALAADLTVASRSARFWEPFTGRGFTPDSGGTWLLPRLVGVARAKDVLLLGRELSGADAAEWGMIHDAVEEEALESTTAALVERLSSAATVAVGLTKWLVHAGASLDLERHLGNEALALELSSRSSDFKEGLAAFRERRPPEFGGR